MNSHAQSNHWHLALPSIAHSEVSVLPVIINDLTFGIPLNQIQYVDHDSVLTQLPLTLPPVEGLTLFNGLPLIQLNVAQALGFVGKPDGKVVILTFPQGYLALKVDEVLGFTSATALATENSGDVDQNLPLLKVNEIFPWIENVQAECLVQTVTELNTKQAYQHATLNSYILLVSSGERNIGLLADSVVRIESVGEMLPLRKQDMAADWVVRIEDVLLPARSLAKLLHCESATERQAILIAGLENPKVLTVERVLRLEQVDSFHATLSPTGKKSLWYLDENQVAIEVVDAREFFAETDSHNNVPVVDPQSRWDNLPQLSAKLSMEGVRIQCGELICVLPLELVERILGEIHLPGSQPDTSTDISSNVLEELSAETTNIPVIDCVALFNQSQAEQTAKNYILLSLPCGQVVIAVHRAELQPTLPETRWSPLNLLPPIATLLFDAATYDDNEKKWVLRAKTHLNFTSFPWEVKRQVVSSLLAWVKPADLEENKNAEFITH